MLEEEGIPCAKCKVGHHLSCLNPIVIPTIPSSNQVLTFAESRTFTCCDKRDFWNRAVYPPDDEGK